MSAAEELDKVERTPEMQYEDLLRVLRQSEHRVNLLARAVAEMAGEMLDAEVTYNSDDGPTSTQALLLAYDCLDYWRS